MIKNIVIGVLLCASVALSVCCYLQSKDNATLTLKLRNTELNLQYEKGLE